MKDNIIELLGFKDKDIKATITKSTPYQLEVTVLQDGRQVSLKVKQRRWKCTNPACGNFISDQFSFVEKYKHNTNMTDFLIVEDFRNPSLSAVEIAKRRNVSDTYAIYTFAIQ